MKQRKILALVITAVTAQLSAATVSIKNEAAVTITLARVTTRSSRRISFLDVWPTSGQQAYRTVIEDKEILTRMKYEIEPGCAIKLEVAEPEDYTWDHFNVVEPIDATYSGIQEKSIRFSSRGPLHLVYNTSHNKLCPLTFYFADGKPSNKDRLSYYVLTLLRAVNGETTETLQESHYLLLASKGQ